MPRQITASLNYGVRRARSAVAWSGELGSCTGRTCLTARTAAATTPGGDRTTRSAPAASTDTVIAVALAETVARSLLRSRGGAGVAVRLHEHSGIPDTLSLGQAASEAAVISLVRSADHFEGVVLVSRRGPSSRSRASSAPRRSQARSRGSPTRRLTLSPVRPSRSTAGSPCSDGRQEHSASRASRVVEASG
jgi:hypothetical protein